MWSALVPPNCIKIRNLGILTHFGLFLTLWGPSGETKYLKMERNALEQFYFIDISTLIPIWGMWSVSVTPNCMKIRYLGILTHFGPFLTIFRPERPERPNTVKWREMSFNSFTYNWYIHFNSYLVHLIGLIMSLFLKVAYFLIKIRYISCK